MSLENVTYWVIDEADRMLDLGFEHQLHEISKMICSTILNASKKKNSSHRAPKAKIKSAFCMALFA